MPLDETTRQRITDLLAQHDVFLFMKGTPEQPQCGFSAATVEILDHVLPAGYGSLDVLGDPDMREGIKEFASWPTIPQIYVKGEFVGGCDIVREMFSSGELYEALGLEKPDWKPPEISITDEAASRIRNAMQGDENQCIVMKIDGVYRTSEMRLAPKPADSDSSGDIKAESNGITVLFDPISSQRADGIRIYLDSSRGGEELAVDNPNAPPPVGQLAAAKLKELLDGNDRLELFDVRSPEERQTASIDRSRLLDAEAQQYILDLPRDTPLFFYCHRGIRSLDAAEFFRAKGFGNVASLKGGIDAWSLEVDSNVARYGG